MDKNSIRIDVVIPSIRADMEQILSMLQLNVPPNVKLCYYIISDRESLSSKDFVYKNSPVRVIILKILERHCQEMSDWILVLEIMFFLLMMMLYQHPIFCTIMLQP